LAVIANLWRQTAAPARELADIEAQIAAMQQQVEPYEEITARAAAIESWLATDVNWLDEIEQLGQRVRPEPLTSKEFPVNDDVVVTQLIVSRAGGTDAVGGHADLQVKAKSDAAVRDLEQRLRATGHRVIPGGVQQDTTVPGYPRSTNLQLQVVPSEDDEPAAPAGPAEPAAATATEAAP
jgi:hypothetical protein